jgi:hypothetical protein
MAARAWPPGSAVDVVAGIDQRTAAMQPLYEDRYT